MENIYSDLKVGAAKNSEQDVTGSVGWPEVERRREEILELWRKDFELPGFRKGNVPAEVFRKHANLHGALQEAAEEVLHEIYPEVIAAADLAPIGRPQVTVTKLAEGNPLEFKIRTALRPEVKLPDYRKIAAKINAARQAPEVSAAEITEVIQSLRKMRAGGQADEAAAKEPPPLTDEFVKTLGNFQNVADFEAKLKDNLLQEKTAEVARAAREEIAAALIAGTKMILPEMLLADETAEALVRLRQDLENAGLKLEDYLKNSGKNEEQLVLDERAHAERQLKTRFILEAIGAAEKIEPEESAVRTEAQIIRERHPDLDPERVRDYVASILRNEKVLEFLESQKE